MSAGGEVSVTGELTNLDLASFRAAYGAFLRPDRILLTGHSHQAWPDVVRAALAQSFDDAARFADDKWAEAVSPLVDRVRARIAVRMGLGPEEDLAFGRSTHELAVRLLSCLAGRRSPRIVTTTGEFHSLWRQLRRLEEEGVAIDWVEASPRESLAERLLAALDRPSSLLAMSAVMFEDAFVVPRLPEIAARAAAGGAIVLIDAYHAFNVVPLPDLGDAFVTAGGYKYAEFGEGICWLRIPPGCVLRPVYTGWFSDFESLEGPRGGPVRYGSGGARFAGSTFDPAPFYRADAVLAHFDRFGLDPPGLRAISIRQTGRILDRLDDGEIGAAGASIETPRDPDRRGGFVSIRTSQARAVSERLRRRGVFTDARGQLLRLGPAPYLTDDEIDDGVARVVEELRR